MDITLVENDNKFFYRVSAIILNKDSSKILLFRVKDKELYMLLGGKVKMLEESNKAITREIKEEIGYENIDFKFLGISEELVNAKGYNNHQLNIIYKGIYKGDIKENVFYGLEGDWCLYEWINISDIDNYNIFPTNIKNMLKNLNTNYHIVENLLERKN